MKRTMLTLSKFFIAGVILVTSVQSTSITSASYNAGTNVLTITFSDSIYTDNILLGRMAFDDDNGGPNSDIVISGGTVLTEDSLSSEIQISLIYDGIIDQWTNPDDQKTRDIWGNNLTLVNTIEALDLSSLQLVIEDGAFINNNNEPFTDADSNDIYSSAEEFTDLNGDSLWTPAEPLFDLNGNIAWDDAEEFTDCEIEADTLICETDDNWNESFGNGTWDDAEEFTDCGINDNGIYICDNNNDWDESFGNGLCDGLEEFSEGFPTLQFPVNGIWDFIDDNGNGVCDNTGPSPLWECEQFVDDNGNEICDQEILVDADGDGIWFPGEELTDLNGNNVWDGAEEFTDCGINDNGIYICDTDNDWNESFGNGVWDGAEPLVDFDGDNEFDEVSEDYTDTNGNGIWDQYEPNSNATIAVTVSGQDVRPDLSSAHYDANINKLTLIFDKPVQFDQIPEDETFL
ncbi:MAG TPA: hypothetical protein DIS65_03855, partial [Candidatus Marinimicrobia bacterium]|nr:hypothetical protein [Candidatus Neomarinimicrobiota bacterium]